MIEGYERDKLYCPKCANYAFFAKIKDNKITLQCMMCKTEFDRKGFD